MQTILDMVSKNLASKQKYTPISQLTLEGFETPFVKSLKKENRWVVLSSIIPWDKIVSIYDKNLRSTTGRPPINGRVVLGAMIIKHFLKSASKKKKVKKP